KLRGREMSMRGGAIRSWGIRVERSLGLGKETTMQARMKNPVLIVPDVLPALYGVGKAVTKGTVPASTLTLIHLRGGQINGCAYCVDMHARELREAGETVERLSAVAAWRDAPYFADAERAALGLAEAATRLADRSDPVPDEVWNEATK